MKILRMPFKTQIHYALIPFITFIIFSCSSKSELANHIPKEATAVMTLDVKSMALKSLDFEKLLTFDNLKKFVGSVGEKKDSVEASVANSGLDFTSTIYVFGQMQDINKYAAAVAKLSDAKKFEDFVKASNSTVGITEEGDMKFAKFTNEKGIVAWNKNEVFVVMGDPMPKERVLTLVNLKKEESLATTNDSFKQSQKDGGDISVWVSFADFAKSIPQYGASFQTMNLKDTYLSASCNFEDGQIVVDTKYTANPSAPSNKLVKAGVNSEIVKMLSGKSLIGLIGFAFDMDQVYRQLEKQNVVQPYDPTAKQMTGLSIREFMTTFSGDIAITLNGIEMKDVMQQNPFTGQMISKKQPVADYSVILGIADKERLFKLLDQFTTSGMFTKKDDYYTFQNKIFVFEKGPALIITASEDRMKSYDDANGEKLSAELVAMLNTSCSSMYFNIANIPDDVYGTQGVVRDNIKKSEFQSLTFTATAVKATSSEAKLVIKFKNKDENALVTIGRVSKKFKSLNRMQPAADSTTAPNF